MTTKQKKQIVDAKKLAANDKKENGNGKTSTASKRIKFDDAKFCIGSVATVKRGFLKEFCDFAAKKGTVNLETLVKEFSGRQIDGHKVDAARIARYIRYCVNNGQFKVAK